MQLLFDLGLVIIFTKWGNRKDKQLTAILTYADSTHTATECKNIAVFQEFYSIRKKNPKFAEFLAEKDHSSSLHACKRSNQREYYTITLFFTGLQHRENDKGKSRPEIFLIYFPIFDISFHNIVSLWHTWKMIYTHIIMRMVQVISSDLTQDLSFNSKWDFELKSSRICTMSWWGKFLNEVIV